MVMLSWGMFGVVLAALYRGSLTAYLRPPYAVPPTHTPGGAVGVRGRQLGPGGRLGLGQVPRQPSDATHFLPAYRDMMLRVWVVAASLVVVFTQGEWSSEARSPFSQDLISSLSQMRKNKRTSQTGITTTDVIWLQDCSPRLAYVTERQDAALRCNLLAPSGTQLTWYKNNFPLLRQGAAQEVSQALSRQEALEEHTNMVEYQGSALSSVDEALSARLHFVSLVYIDCVDAQDVADYSLEVTTPNNQVVFRNFTLQITGQGQQGQTCRYSTAVVNNLPRIFQYSLEARAEVGAALTLPCRSQGFYTRHVWYFNNSPLPSAHPNYQVLTTGDLMIQQVTQQSYGSYTCRVVSTRFTGLEHNVYTQVNPQVRTI
nr:uncharacterized protein LOC123775205 isoform X1 [Procambarus clarkii]